MPPKVCFGMVVYNQVKHLPAAIESILTQTHPHFRLIISDDSTMDEPGQIALGYAAQDGRVEYYRNPTRRGYVDNSVLAFERAGPDVDYFAWAGDHDVWHPRWLETLLCEMEAHREVLLAYPLTIRIDDHGQVLPVPVKTFDTFGLTPRQRVAAICDTECGFGNMIYGLFRADALRRGGALRRTVLCDHLLLTELALYGPYKQVREPLWFRRYHKEDASKAFSLARQRRTLFAGPADVPFHVSLPWWLVHTAALAWNLSLAPARNTSTERALGLDLTGRFLLTWFHRGLVYRPLKWLRNLVRRRGRWALDIACRHLLPARWSRRGGIDMDPAKRSDSDPVNTAA